VRRREFLSLVGLMAATPPFAAHAQQPLKPPTIGFLVAGTAASHRRWVDAFVQRLGELGWIEGRTLAIQYGWAEGRTEIAAELVRRNVNVIVTSGTAMVQVAKQATSDIPIVFAAAGDPVGTGLVASLPHPGGNVTGLSLQQTDLAAKRLQVFSEAVPGVSRLAILANVRSPAVLLDMGEVQAAARTLGIEVVSAELQREDEIALLLEALRGRAQALYVVNDPLVDSNRDRINAAALSARLPTMYGSREHVEAGGLMSYGADFTDMFRRSAVLVDKILRGAAPAGLPVEQPTKFELVLNLKTANALGLAIPPTLLARADEVIELGGAR
jgi:putative tryptophan/tyrosine transport system substrate-binding protein